MKVDVIVLQGQTLEQQAAEEVCIKICSHSAWEENKILFVEAKGYSTEKPNVAKVVIVFASKENQENFSKKCSAILDIIQADPIETHIGCVTKGEATNKYSVLCFVPYEVND